MDRGTLGDLLAFLAVARERSFTRAAAHLGVSTSALSHTVRGLETRLDLRLLTRTTRSVAPTQAGERLLSAVGPLIEEIQKEWNALTELRTRPAGRIRLTSVEHAAETLLWPAVRRLVSDYPDIKVEICAGYGLTDIVTDRFDAGVRLGEHVAPGMIATRIGPDMRMAVVAAPSYLKRNATPRSPADLVRHRCIHLQLHANGTLLPWTFRKGRRELKVKAEGPLVFNSLTPIIRATTEGFGLAYTVADSVRELIGQGKLISVLEEWCPTVQGYHLYYPSRRHPPPAFTLLLEALRRQRDHAG